MSERVNPETYEPVEIEHAMGQCLDCRKQWSMPSTENKWWRDLIQKEHAHFPKRCKPCRERRTHERETETLCSSMLRRLIKDYDAGEVDTEELFFRFQQLLGEVEGVESRVRGLRRRMEKTSKRR